MYWEEQKTDDKTQVSDDVVDIVYNISCRMLPVDHVYELSESLMRILPWLKSEEYAGIHAIHVATSGNGWMRPENADDMLHLSKRTKLILRVPKHRVNDAAMLAGQTLQISGNNMVIKESPVTRPLSTETTIFSRYVVIDDDSNEEVFLEKIYSQLHELGIKPRKMLCGRENLIKSAEGDIKTRSLMLAELQVKDSVKLQQHGLGPYRHMGCGLFIPHKGIQEVKQDLD